MANGIDLVVESALELPGRVGPTTLTNKGSLMEFSPHTTQSRLVLAVASELSGKKE